MGEGGGEAAGCKRGAGIGWMLWGSMRGTLCEGIRVSECERDGSRQRQGGSCNNTRSSWKCSSHVRTTHLYDIRTYALTYTVKKSSV